MNTAKTEIFWSTSGRHIHQLPQLLLRVGTDEVLPVTVVHVDADVSMRSCVTKTGLLRSATSTPLHSSVCTEIRSPVAGDISCLVAAGYGNAVLAGIPSYLVTRLQSMMNAAVRLVFSLRGLTTSPRSSVNCIG